MLSSNLGPFRASNLPFVVYSSLNSGRGIALHLSEANINEMDLEGHPQYQRPKQIIRLTLGHRGNASIWPNTPAKAAFLATGLALLAATAAAQSNQSDPPQGDTRITISDTDCRALVRYIDNGSAAYKPGVDVHGRPVAGANLSDKGTDLIPSEITFTLSLRLGDFAPDIAAGLADSAAAIAEITVRGQEVFLNERPLTDLQSEVLADQCRAKLADTDNE